MNNTTKTILVVEDDKHQLELLTRLLDVNGYNVIGTSDGLDTMKLATAHKPDLIIMDLQLFLLSGVHLIKTLKNMDEFKDIPITACTASPLNEVKKELKANNCDGYISKPIIDIDQFYSDIETLITDKHLDY